MEKHIIDPVKLAKTFQLPWVHPGSDDNDIGEISNRDNDRYLFYLSEDEKKASMEFYFRHVEPDTIFLRFEIGNSYESFLYFRSITNVEYFPKDKMICLKSKEDRHPSLLKLWWRGQFELW